MSRLQYFFLFLHTLWCGLRSLPEIWAQSAGCLYVFRDSAEWKVRYWSEMLEAAERYQLLTSEGGWTVDLCNQARSEFLLRQRRGELK